MSNNVLYSSKTTGNDYTNKPYQNKNTIYNVPVRVRLIEVKDQGNIFDYKDPFYGGYNSPVPEANAPDCLPAILSKIIYTSDATPSTCSIIVDDSKNTKYNFKNILGYFHKKTNNSYIIPKIGDAIVVYMYNDTREDMYNNFDSNNGWVIIFKGYVSSVNKNIGQDGMKYTIGCEDIKVRLRDNCIRKVYNNSFKISSIPNLSEKQDVIENPYTTQKMKIKDIVEDIFEYSKRIALNAGSYEKRMVLFDYNSIDWNGNDDLKDFIPQSLSFDNTTIFEAIYRTINSYGNYRIVLDYSDQKLYICKLSYGAKKCGSKLKLVYADPNNNSEWYNVNVVGDNTWRRTRDTCDILRCYTGPIEWYSGHFYIRSSYTYNSDGKMTGSSRSNYTPGWDKFHDNRFVIRNKNFDGYDYIFGLGALPGFSDDLKRGTLIVGAPLYPSWNIYQGYGPRKRNFSGIAKYAYNNYADSRDPLKSPSVSYEEGSYQANLGATDNDLKGFVDPDFRSVMGSNTSDMASSYSYEAWFPYGICPLCNGYGAVSYDASNQFDLFGKSRKMSGVSTGVFGNISKPFQYNFVEKSVDGIKTLVPSNHPIPWKNTCPMCRGTGMEPWFRMTSIANNLVDVTPDLMKMGEDDNNDTIEEYKTNGYKNKTWSEIAREKSLRKDVIIHVEDVMSGFCYDLSKLDSWDSKIEHSLSSSVSGYNNRQIFDTASQPRLRYVQGLYYTGISEAKGFQIDSDRGMVIFKEKKNIPCVRPQCGISTVRYNNREYLPIIVDNSNGNEYVKYANKGTMLGTSQKAKSYWRPARAWITCYFRRDMLKAPLGGENSSKTRFSCYFPGHREYTVKRVVPDEDDKQYTISAGIEDNRYYIEIMNKHYLSSEYKVRPIVKGITLNDFKWQICPYDLGRWNVSAFTDDGVVNKIELPNDYGNLWDKLYKITKNRKGYMYPTGSVHVMEQINDEEMKSAGYTKSQIETMQRSDFFGKVLRWVHKDDRVKLIEKGIAELERRNDVEVTGTISIKGGAPKFRNGFGYVNLSEERSGTDNDSSGDLKACVVKIELDFTKGCVANLEVSTEEMRIGQMKEEEKEYQRKIESQIANLNYNIRGTNGYSSPGSINTGESNGGGLGSINDN